MRGLPELDPQRIGLLGQSEGTIIALGLTAVDSAIPFIVLQGGPYQNLRAILQWQAEAFWRQEEATINGLKYKVPVLYWVYRQWQAINDSIDRGDTFFTLGDAAWSLELYLPWFREHYAPMGGPGEMPGAHPPRRARSQCARYRCQAAAGRLGSGRKYGCHPLSLSRPGSQFPSTW
jgi:hypothetical protein